MIGTVECSTQSLKTLFEVARHPSVIAGRESMSLRTQLALQVANLLVFPENKVYPEVYRQLSNVIYAANSYFDIGLRVREQLNRNKPSQFLGIETIYHQTRASLFQAVTELTESRPDLIDVVAAFVNDGERLYQSKNDISAVAYREIDSGIAAILVFGTAIDQEELARLVPSATRKCANTNELMNKYTIFRTSDLMVENLPKDPTIRKIIGLQAIEMLLALFDDGWGVEEDGVLGTPNIINSGADTSILKKHYRKTALECDVSPAVIKIATTLVHAHRFRVYKKREEIPIELCQINRYPNIGRIFLLREWLKDHALLDEVLR